MKIIMKMVIRVFDPTKWNGIEAASIVTGKREGRIRNVDGKDE